MYALQYGRSPTWAVRDWWMTLSHPTVDTSALVQDTITMVVQQRQIRGQNGCGAKQWQRLVKNRSCKTTRQRVAKFITGDIVKEIAQINRSIVR